MSATPFIRWKSLTLLLALLGSGAAQAADYAAGQLWTYRHRPVDGDSQVLIDRVEPVPGLGTVYHLSILRVHVTTQDGSVTVIDLPHCPVSAATLKMSLVARVGTRAPLDEYLNGYAAWKQAFEAGRAGIYTIALSDIVAMLEVTLKKAQPKQGLSL